MAATWPSTLQESLDVSGFSFGVGETLLRSTMDTGPYKTRKRFTKALDTISGTIKMSREEWNTFRTFYDVTLSNGSLPFEYTDPMTLVATDYKFTAPPNAVSIGGNYYQIAMKWVLA